MLSFFILQSANVTSERPFFFTVLYIKLKRTAFVFLQMEFQLIVLQEILQIDPILFLHLSKQIFCSFIIQNQPVFIIQDRQLRVSLRQRPEDACGAAVFDDNITVLHADQLVHAAAEAEISLYNKRLHNFVLLCAKRLICGISGVSPWPYRNIIS